MSPAIGDERVVDRRPDACFHGELVERRDARFAVPARTSSSAASLVLSPTFQAPENRPRQPVRTYAFAMRRPSRSLLLRGEMTRRRRGSPCTPATTHRSVTSWPRWLRCAGLAVRCGRCVTPRSARCGARGALGRRPLPARCARPRLRPPRNRSQ